MNILWDFDGTIFDTYHTIVNNVYREISEERKHIISKKEILELLKVNAKFAMDMLDFTEEQRQKVYQRQYDIFPEESPPFPYVKEVLESADLNVIMTHKSRESVLELLEFFGLKHLFKEIISKNDGFPKKPNPESYKYLNNKYKIDLVIGDRILDLLPARELGIKTCSFNNHLPKANYYLDRYENFPIVLLGLQYGINSHSKKMPYFSTGWLEKYFHKGSELFIEIESTAMKSRDKRLAYLYKIGLSDKLKVSGFYPIDSALFAMEHGFPGSIVKSILFQKGINDLLKDQNDEIKELYRKMSKFITNYDLQHVRALSARI